MTYSRIYHMEEQMKQTHGDDWKASMKIKIEVKGYLRSNGVITGQKSHFDTFFEEQLVYRILC